MPFSLSRSAPHMYTRIVIVSLFFPLIVVYLSRAPEATDVSAVAVLFSMEVVKYCAEPEDPLPPVRPVSVPSKS